MPSLRPLLLAGIAIPLLLSACDSDKAVSDPAPAPATDSSRNGGTGGAGSDPGSLPGAWVRIESGSEEGTTFADTSTLTFGADGRATLLLRWSSKPKVGPTASDAEFHSGRWSILDGKLVLAIGDQADTCPYRLAESTLVILGDGDSAVYKRTEILSAPVLTPDGGSYGSSQKVAMSTATSGATIHYTTDGSRPTSASPTYAQPLTVGADRTVKAIAIKNGAASPITTATYDITASGPALDPDLVGMWQMVDTTVDDGYREIDTIRFDFRPDGGLELTTIRLETELATGSTSTNTDGSDGTWSADGASLILRSKSTASDTLEYALAEGRLRLGGASSSRVFTRYERVAPPELSLPSGAYGATQTLRISDSTADAVVRYTLDGTLPTNVSKVYSEPITIASTTQVTATAFKNGIASKAVSATYTILTPQGEDPALMGTWTYREGDSLELTLTLLQNHQLRETFRVETSSQQVDTTFEGVWSLAGDTLVLIVDGDLDQGRYEIVDGKLCMGGETCLDRVVAARSVSAPSAPANGSSKGLLALLLPSAHPIGAHQAP